MKNLTLAIISISLVIIVMIKASAYHEPPRERDIKYNSTLDTMDVSFNNDYGYDNTSYVNINIASLKELMTLPGVNKRLAIKIMNARINLRGYKTDQQFIDVIGSYKFNIIKHLIFKE